MFLEESAGGACDPFRLERHAYYVGTPNRELSTGITHHRVGEGQENLPIHGNMWAGQLLSVCIWRRTREGAVLRGSWKYVDRRACISLLLETLTRGAFFEKIIMVLTVFSLSH